VTGTLQAADVLIGLLTENTPKLLSQAVRLLRSIRWFGGGLARSRVIVCGVGPLETRAQAALLALGAEVRTVTRFHAGNPAANRHQLLASVLGEPERLLLLLDCDTLITEDPLPFLGDDAFQAKVAPFPTITDEVFARLFAHFGLSMPERTFTTRFTGTATIPYFNAGVMAVPMTIAGELAPAWRKYNQILADEPDLVRPCERNMHQAALALALAATRVPVRALPDALNYQLNATHVPAPDGWLDIEPVILHYHHLATEDGFLLPTPYPRAQLRIDRFHERLRSEGITPASTTTPGTESPAVVVLGMHRSGTSLLTELLVAMGCHAGTPDVLLPGDLFNPTGYWENREVAALNEELLREQSARWDEETTQVDVAMLPDARRSEFVARARQTVERLRGRGAVVVKDPRMSLLFPLWREALGDPFCVIAWRDPFAVAESLRRRDQRPTLAALALWELYTRRALRETEGLPRVLVSYEALLADPENVTEQLYESLLRAGVRGVERLTAERIRQTVHQDFDRSSRTTVRRETLLTPDQRDLLAALESGDALRITVPPLSAFAERLLADHDAMRRQQHKLGAEIDQLDDLLGVVFESRTWRVGTHVTSLARLLRRERAVTAHDRWQNAKRKRDL
jgi:hypothetical protein